MSSAEFLPSMLSVKLHHSKMELREYQQYIYPDQTVRLRFLLNVRYIKNNNGIMQFPKLDRKISWSKGVDSIHRLVKMYMLTYAI